MIRYAITDGESTAEELLERSRRWVAEGVDYVQLREKQRPAGELVTLAEAMVEIFRDGGSATKLLVNGRADVAVAAVADGVHLTSRQDELTAEQVRKVFSAAGRGVPVISISCHSVAEVKRASEAGADLIVFGPVFGKSVRGEVVVAGIGLERLREACIAVKSVPVLALGGLTIKNAGGCVEAGAAGIAGIRLFQ